MTDSERAATAQILSEMSLLLAVSNIYLAGRYADIMAGLDFTVGADSTHDLETKRKSLHANLVTSCVPAVLVNSAAVFVFVQPIGTGKIRASDICAWGCDVFPLAYAIVFAFFALLLLWSIVLTSKTVIARGTISRELNRRNQPPPGTA